MQTEGVKALKSENLMEWLRPVEDPELHLSLVELGLIYAIHIKEENIVDVQMTLTSPSCPAAPYMIEQVKNRVLEYEGVKDANVELVFEPKWDPKSMASDDAKEVLGLW